MSDPAVPQIVSSALLVASRSPVSRWTVVIATPLRINKANQRNLALLAIGLALLFAASGRLRRPVLDITERKRRQPGHRS